MKFEYPRIKIVSPNGMLGQTGDYLLFIGELFEKLC